MEHLLVGDEQKRKTESKNAKKDDPRAANSSIPWVWLLKGGKKETANRRRWSPVAEEGNGDVAAMQGFRRGLAWWGGRGSRGGAPELSGGARGGR